MSIHFVLTKKRLKHANAGRCQTFQKHYYRFENGYAIRQFLRFNGPKREFVDWGDPVPIIDMFQEIHVLLDEDEKVYAIRKNPGLELLLHKQSSLKNMERNLQIIIPPRKGSKYSD